MEFDIGTKHIDIETHRDEHGPHEFAAANVKYPGGKKQLPVKYRAKLDRLIALGRTTQQQFDDWVWQDFQEAWWERFGEDAKEAGVGRIASAGRGGGWLILCDYTRVRLEQTYDDATIACRFCHKPLISHACAPYSCLFGSTRFEPLDEDMTIDNIVRSTDALFRVATFLTQCEDAVRSYAHADFIYQQKFRIDDLWERYRDESAPASRILHSKDSEAPKSA